MVCGTDCLIDTEKPKSHPIEVTVKGGAESGEALSSFKFLKSDPTILILFQLKIKLFAAFCVVTYWGSSFFQKSF